MQIWLLSHCCCHTTTIPYWHVCSDCHGWFTVLQLSFDVGVKQGCIIAPIIFIMFLVAMSLVSHSDLKPSDSVGYEYSLMVVSSTCSVLRQILRFTLHRFLPLCTPMMQPFLSLLLTDFNIILMSSLRHTSVVALLSVLQR